MPGLSDTYLFTGWDLENNPIKMRISKTLKMSDKEFDKPFIVKPFPKPQCDNISMQLSRKQWDAIFGKEELISSLLGKKIKIDELQDKINDYMKKKCEEYCKVNRIAFEVWWSFATYESYGNKWEIRYKGEVVCGAKVNCELKDDNSTEVGVSLELY